MRLLAILWIAAGVASAATSYTAASLQQSGSTVGFANIYGLNNNGQVLGDACAVIIGGITYSCSGADRFPAVWSNGVFTPLTMPTGCTYSAEGGTYRINDSGTVHGWVGCGSLSKVAVWTNGVAVVLPDPPIPGAGSSCSTSGSSIPYGINAAGHILGSTSYAAITVEFPCSANWVFLYDGAECTYSPSAPSSCYRILEYGPYEHAGISAYSSIPIPFQCLGLPDSYYPGVEVNKAPAINDADQVLGTLQNDWCGPPYISPGWGPIGQTDPFVTQTNNSYSFLPLGSLSNATGFSINDVGTVLGGLDGGDGFADLLVWDNNGNHEFPGGYGYLNNAGQVVYLTTSGGGIAMWQNGVSTPVQLPSEITGVVLYPVGLNDAGQFVVTAGGGQYLLSPSGTTTAAAPATITFSPASQNVPLTATVTSTGGTIDGGMVTFTVPGVGTVTSGTVTDGAASAVLTVPAGMPAATYSIQAAYSGAAGFADSNDNSKALTIQQATPMLTWAAPAAITYGSALSSSQLDAAASVPGTFVYNPPAGTVLPAGVGETLSVTFTPTDTTDYTAAGTSTTITVNPAAPPASPADLVVTRLLTRSGGNVLVQLTISNTGGTEADNVVLTNVRVGADVATPLPQNLGTIAAGVSVQATVTVPGSVGASGAASSLTVSGTYSGGTFNSSSRITLP
jgi:hypothetical protein